jgi:ArsR family transcriptional regulator
MNVEVAVRVVATFFKALADESRLQILWLLMNHRELCVCDIMAALSITQSKASRHLATLRHAGLVTDRREGTWSHYALRAADGELERAQLAALRDQLARLPDAARLLRDLHACLARARRDADCAAESPCCATTKRQAAPARRLPRTGETP